MYLEKNYMDKVYAGEVSMYYPMTPGEWLDEKPTYTDVVSVLMTCGGGIGGDSWHEYLVDVTVDDIVKSDKYIVANTIRGKRVVLNTNYIVKTSECKVASAIYHSENPYYEKGDYIVRYLLSTDATAKLVHKYKSR